MKFPAVIVLVVILAVTLVGCATHSKPSCCAKPEAAAAASDKSIYLTDANWMTDAQKQIKLRDLGGRPQVVVMFFANCQFACPILVLDLKRLEAALPPEVRARVGFTLVSFDTRRDTPAMLAQYRQTHELAAERWTLLHGQADDVLELALLLGLKFKEDANGQFAHSNIITILNAQGEIMHQQVGLNQDSAETVHLLRQLTAKQFHASAQ